MIVRALDHSSALIDAPAVTAGGVIPASPFRDLGIRVASAEAIIRGALPSADLPPGVLRRAVELWPRNKAPTYERFLVSCILVNATPPSCFGTERHTN